jgi:uncharacterized protein with PIN domain
MDSVRGEEGLFHDARLVFRGGLAELLRHGRGREPALLRFRADQSLAQLVESLGLPRLEVGRALVDGQDWSLALPPPDKSLVELLPLEEPLETGGEPRFALDVHLGRLARELRLLGFDLSWRNDWEDHDLVLAALAEERIVLTRDRALLFRRELHGSPLAGMLIRSREAYAQLLEVCRRFGLAPRLRPFSLCASCGSALVAADKAELVGLIPAIVAERYEEFYRCPVCGKPYWKGDHFRNLLPFLDRLRADLA